MTKSKITPSKLFRIDESKLTNEQIEAFKDAMRKRYTGPGDNMKIVKPILAPNTQVSKGCNCSKYCSNSPSIFKRIINYFNLNRKLLKLWVELLITY